MNPSTTIIRVWLILAIAAFIHSCFPPRVSSSSGESIGRSFILSSKFFKVDYFKWQESWSENKEIADQKAVEFARREIKHLQGPSSSVTEGWNPASFDFGTYLAELVAMIAIGAVATCLSKIKANKA